MKCVVYISLSLGLITALHESDWKPILGNSPALKTIQQPIVVDTVLKAASSSKSTITFNGRTITTSIGDGNDAAGPVLTVGSPDLTADIDGIDEEPRYLGYGGKILNGFYAPTISVSFIFAENWKYFFCTVFRLLLSAEKWKICAKIFVNAFFYLKHNLKNH